MEDDRTTLGDVRDLGLLAFELLTGEPPVPDEALPSVTPLAPGLPPALGETIAAATAGEPEPPIEDIEEFLARLRGNVEMAPSGHWTSLIQAARASPSTCGYT